VGAPESDAGRKPLERARAAGARFLLHGNVRRDAEGYVAGLQILETESGTQKWSIAVAAKPGDDTGAQGRGTPVHGG